MAAKGAAKSKLTPFKEALSVKGLTYRAGGQTILRDITFGLPRGELIGILGPNGAGKTTLLKTITGYLRPSHGQITVLGRNLHSMTPVERARKMAFLPQNLEVPFSFSAKEMVTMGRYCHAAKGDETRARAARAMDACGISQLAHRPFSSLSGGERRLVLLARCLCQDSPIFLLDEATASLDIRRKMEVFELLRKEVNLKGRTVVIVVHDINLASLYLDRLLFIKDGKVAGQGTVKELLHSGFLSEVFETRTIVMNHPECNRPVVLFSPSTGLPNSSLEKGGDSHV